MSLFSFLRKKKQDESSSGNSEFLSRAEEESKAVRGRGSRKSGSKADGPIDPVLPEKKRARRRLVGAVALVLAIVIGLPMVLDSEPKPVAGDIEIQIPSKDKTASIRASSTALPPPPALTVSASHSLEHKEEVLPAADPNAKATEIPTPKLDMPKADQSKSSELKSDKPAVKSETQINPQPKPQPKIDAKPKVEINPIIAKDKNDKTGIVTKTDDTDRAQSILEGKPDAKKIEAKPVVEKKSGKYSVQVAALATKEKIDEVQAKLKEAGFQSYTQKIATESGDRTRIRVGPFDSKEEAEQMRAKLIKSGMGGTIVPSVN